MELILLLVLVDIASVERILHPFVSDTVSWEIALGAKYLSLAVILTLLLQNTSGKTLLFRSIVALFCIGAWIDFVGHVSWQVHAFDSSMPVYLIWSMWLVFAIRRAYDYQGDPVSGENVFLMLLRPTTVFAVCKALAGFPVASVCLYANGSVWSFRAKTGTFDLYPVDARWLYRHITINTGVHCTDEITEMLGDLVGQRRWPGTKCVWAIRHVLARLGKTYKPRLFDYLPGIYAMRIIKGRG